jgi:hypothetical protein
MKADLPNLRVSPLMKIDGGVSQNDFVNQFIANMTGREIIRHPHPDQMTALGAAFLAGLGAGANHLHVRPLHIIDSTFSLPPTGRHLEVEGGAEGPAGVDAPVHARVRRGDTADQVRRVEAGRGAGHALGAGRRPQPLATAATFARAEPQQQQQQQQQKQLTT